jgi:hypothetical protein
MNSRCRGAWWDDLINAPAQGALAEEQAEEPSHRGRSISQQAIRVPPAPRLDAISEPIHGQAIGFMRNELKSAFGITDDSLFCYLYMRPDYIMPVAI